MSSLFSWLTVCCSRSTPPENEGETQLLLPGDGVPVYVAPDTAAVDRERVKERLGNIVRSKEGKMVNVTDHLPFNLNHRDPNGASSSRLRAESPSPHPSVETGDSMASRSSSFRLRGGRPGIPKEPALSVRLIRGRDGQRSGTSRGRLGRFDEERGDEWAEGPLENGEGSSDASDQIPEHASVNGVVPDIIPLDDVDKDAILSLSDQIGQQLQDGWKIEDAGPISRGWGD
ncbi:hypothetical protein M422DRAFT_66021 [Sphaerobolus stellatus SS14]|nr:hypothetical protein M422DRAFT_66021 [Sphaerobolus stellatus SS14]